MSERGAEALAGLLIRNFNEADDARDASRCMTATAARGSLAGTAARKLRRERRHRRAGHMRSLPVPPAPRAGGNVHRAFWKGRAISRVAGELLRAARGRHRVHPARGRSTRTRSSTRRTLPLSVPVDQHPKSQPEVVRVSGFPQVLTMASLPEGKFFDPMQRADNSLDYWDGEP